jgi:hypothetical protein
MNNGRWSCAVPSRARKVMIPVQLDLNLDLTCIRVLCQPVVVIVVCVHYRWPRPTPGHDFGRMGGCDSGYMLSSIL